MKLPRVFSFPLASAALTACAVLSAAPAAAQERVPPLIAAAPVAPEPARQAARPGVSADSLRVRRPAGERFALRSVAGLGGWAGGALVGAVTGAGMEGDCNCDDPGLGGALVGAAVGGAAGAALVSAAPRFGAQCTFGTRLWRGALASAAGTAIGFVLAGGWEHPLIFTAPIGASVGAAVGADC